MTRFLLICLGGAFGTGARYLVSVGALRLLGHAFPYGTFLVNVVGSFLMGAIMHEALTAHLLSPTERMFLTTGLLGGFTTYSSFNYETVRYVQEGDFVRAAFYVTATVLFGLVAGFLGFFVAKRLVG